MKKASVVIAAVSGFALGAASMYPSYRQIRDERDDARTALSAVGSTIVASAPRQHIPEPSGYARRRPQRDRSNEVREEESLAYDMPEAPQAATPDEPTHASEQTTPNRNERWQRRDNTQLDPEAREARRQQFAARMRERTEAARTDFVERLQLDGEHVAKLDNTILDLNQGARDVVDGWVDYIRQSGAFDADFQIRFMHDLTAQVVAAYDTLDNDLPPNWRNDAGDFSLMRFIDQETLRPLMELQREMGYRGPNALGMLQSGGMRGGGTGGGQGRGQQGGGFRGRDGGNWQRPQGGGRGSAPQGANQ